MEESTPLTQKDIDTQKKVEPKKLPRRTLIKAGVAGFLASAIGIKLEGPKIVEGTQNLASATVDATKATAEGLENAVAGLEKRADEIVNPPLQEEIGSAKLEPSQFPDKFKPSGYYDDDERKWPIGIGTGTPIFGNPYIAPDGSNIVHVVRENEGFEVKGGLITDGPDIHNDPIGRTPCLAIPKKDGSIFGFILLTNEELPVTEHKSNLNFNPKYIKPLGMVEDILIDKNTGAPPKPSEITTTITFPQLNK